MVIIISNFRHIYCCYFSMLRIIYGLVILFVICKRISNLHIFTIDL